MNLRILWTIFAVSGGVLVGLLIAQMPGLLETSATLKAATAAAFVVCFVGMAVAMAFDAAP